MEFNRSNKSITGKYSEAVALASFLADGCEVAMPYGNQAGWDLLVQEDGAWKRIQVKTAIRNKLGTITIDLGRTTKRGYTRDEVDYVVAVLPESGTVWKIDIAKVENKPAASCEESDVWVTAGLRSLPEPKRKPRTCAGRRLLENCIVPDERPESINERNWQALLLYRDGKSTKEIADSLCANRDALSDAIQRAISYLPRRDGSPHRAPRKPSPRLPIRDRLSKLVIPDDRPQNISPLAWDSLIAFKSGAGYYKIAKASGLDPTSIKDRIESAIKKLSPIA